MGVLGVGIELQGDEARQARDGRAQAPDVDPQQQRRRLIGEAREHQRRGHVADDLAGQQARPVFPPLQQPVQHAHHGVDPRQVPGEDEEGQKGQQQHEIRLQQHLAIQQQQGQHHAAQHPGPAQKPQHRHKAQAEERQIQPEPFLLQPRRLAEKDLHRLPGQQQAGRQDQRQGQEPDGEGDAQKLPHAQLVVGVEVQVLGVAHGGQHTAQVGRHGLQHHHPDQRLFLPRQPQHHHREGHEGQQRHVVCDEHGGEEAQQHQQQPQPPEAAGFFAQQVRQMGEEPGLPEPRHHHHQAVEQRQGAQIRIVQITCVRRHEDAAHQRRQRRDQQNRLPPDKGANTSHKKPPSL